jgi:peptide chain release factor 2
LEIEKISATEDMWKDKEGMQNLLRERKQLENFLQKWDGFEVEVRDLEAYVELHEEDKDNEPFRKEVEDIFQVIEGKIESFEVMKMLSGEQDGNNAIVTIHPGAGGTESQDWASMLFRMYVRWAERNGFAVEVLDLQDGDEAGIKSATFIAEGENAYGYLKAESGVHRLVRISPFDANKRRHTSFASVFVSPEIDEEIVVETRDEDLRIDTYRASGAGGQHVNKTDSAVRITHIPSGIVAQCQNERSQHKNKAMALKILKSKLYELELRQRQEKLAELHRGKKDIAWGSQIRSYVLQPYRMVKDHRTDIQEGNVDAVLDGDIDSFIKAYLLSTAN